MKFKCDCGWTGNLDTNIDEREEAYQGRVYEPVPPTCPECGSDELESKD